MERQMSLESISQKRYWEINDPRAKSITQKIMNMIAVDNQPFSISEDKSFIDLIAYLQPRYLIPSRRYFSDVMLPQTYDAMKAVITAEISPSNATYVSFTSDIWACDHSNESFLSLTAHWINRDFKARNAVLHSKHFPESHTGENIRLMLKDMISEWSI